MPSENLLRSKQGSEAQPPDRYAVVAQRNGDRFVWDRENGKGHFLREDVWPQCSIEERPVPSGQKQKLVVAHQTAVDAVFVRYVRQKRLSDAALSKAGRHSRRRTSGRWLLTLVEAAHEVDYLTEVLGDTVRRSGAEDLLARLDELPPVDEKWFICQKNHRLLHRPPAGPGMVHRFGRPTVSNHVLRCMWRNPTDGVEHDLVIFYGFRTEHESECLQLWYRKSSDVKDYQHLMEVDSYMVVDTVENMEWRSISKERAMEELMVVPQESRTSPRSLALMTQVFLLARQQRFANMLCLAQSAAMYESGLIIERDALRDEIAVYRRQLAMSGSGPSGWNIATKDSELPHYVDAMRSYHRLVDRVKNFYFDFKDGAMDSSKDVHSQKLMFASFIHDTLQKMSELLIGRYKELLHGCLTALGNLECIHQVSRSTHDAFDVYCRKHWRNLFLNHLYPQSMDENTGPLNGTPGMKLKEHMANEFPDLVESKSDTSNFEKIFNGLWESTVVLFLQKPQLRFSIRRKSVTGVFSGSDFDWVDRGGEEGDDVVVLLPPITKKNRPCSFDEGGDGMCGLVIVERGYVDLL